MATTPGYIGLVDGFQAITKGMDSGTNVSLLDRQTLSFATNCSTRGYYVSNRPGWAKQPITFPTTGTDYHPLFEDTLFQGAIFYAPTLGGPFLVSAHAGRVFLLDIKNDYSLSEITTAGVYMQPNIRHIWMAQAEDWLCVQDGIGPALLYNGSLMHQADANLKELPTGEAMAYSMGRLWLAKGRYYIGSDLMIGTSDSPKYTENDVINLGGSFAVPQQGGPIIGFHTVANLDSSLGEGGLAIFTRNGVFILNVPFDRTQWKNLTSMPLQSVALLKYGATSAESIVPVNSDLFFRSKGGLRSLQISRRDFGSWGQVPISAELGRVMEFEDTKLLDSASGVLLNNRLLFTVTPEWNPVHGTFHLGLGVIDFDPISGLGKQARPVYDGIYTGAKILQLVGGEVDGVDRAWAYVVSPTGKIEVWELETDWLFDGENNDERISWGFETGQYDCKLPNELKKLQMADLWYDQLAETVEFTLKYRPDSYSGWFDWHTWTETAPVFHGTPTLGTWPLPQYRTRKTIPVPADVDNPEADMAARFGYAYQFKLDVKGPARIKCFRVKFSREVEPEFNPIA